jgi:two-component system, NarL family, response regulator DevR
MTHTNLDSIRLLLVDDHEVVRLGLKALLERTGTIEIVGEAGSVASAVSEAIRLKPHVVLMDVRLPDGHGAEACREIRAACPDTRVLFLTSFADEDAVVASIIGGADGYLLKEIAGKELIRAITMVAAGHSILDPGVTGPMLARMRSSPQSIAKGKGEPLSQQEERVLALVAEGKTNKEIAVGLDLSEKTVKNYLRHVFQKLQLTRRSQAAAFYTRQHPK